MAPLSRPNKRNKKGVKSEMHKTTLLQEMNHETLVEEKSNHERPQKIRRRASEGQEETMDFPLSNRILSEARIQLREMQAEREEETGIAALKRAVTSAVKEEREQLLKSEREEEREEQVGRPASGAGGDESAYDFAARGFSVSDSLKFRDATKTSQELGEDNALEGRSEIEKFEDEFDVENDGAFSEAGSVFQDFNTDDVTEDDEAAIRAFFRKDAAPQRTLADIIMEKLKEGGEKGGNEERMREERRYPGLDEKVVQVYTGVGQLLSRFTVGKVPKAFKIIPALSNWEEILFLTNPESYSPNAMYVATKLFASNLNSRMSHRFFSLVLLPRVREDIKKHKRLHFALYQALKKSVYKPSAFFKGILLPLCHSGTCTLREAVILGSIVQKMSIPVLHSSVALMKLAEMGYAGTNSYFIKLLLDKKYSLPYRVIDSVTNHFLKFSTETRQLPVIWHQSLLTFVQRYKNELMAEDVQKLKDLLKKQKHYLMTPEILRELAHVSKSRDSNSKPGEKTGPSISLAGKKRKALDAMEVEKEVGNFPEITFGEAEEIY